MGCISVSAPSVCGISHSTGTHVPTCAGAPVYTHRTDHTQEAEDSNLCKQRKHGNRVQTELAHRYGQGKCRKMQGMHAQWTRAGMVHACNEHVRARKGLCRRRLCRRRCSRQFASMRAVQVYGHGQIWCHCGVSWCICHVSMWNTLPFCLLKISNVSLRCDLLGALGVSAGCRHRVVGDVVSVHLSLPVPCQSAVVQSRRPRGAWTQMACV